MVSLYPYRHTFIHPMVMQKSRCVSQTAFLLSLFLPCLHAQHPIAHADMRLDILRAARALLQLFSQGSHEHPQGGDVAFHAVSPDLAGDIGMGEHLAHVLCQQAQKPVLDGRQMHLGATQIRASRGIVDA